MHIVAKTLIGLGTIGSIGGGGYAVSYLLATNEIADRLVREGYTILQNDSREWGTILNSYKTVATADNKLRFDTFAGTGDKAEEELKKYCENLLKPHTSENTQDSDNYNKAKQWCVFPIAVKDLLKHQGYTSLSTDGKDNTPNNNSQWVTKIKDHKKSNAKIKDLVLDENQDQASEAEVQKIKEKCAEIGSKKNHEADYDTNLDNFKNWCSNK